MSIYYKTFQQSTKGGKLYLIKDISNKLKAYIRLSRKHVSLNLGTRKKQLLSLLLSNVVFKIVLTNCYNKPYVNTMGY